MTGSALVGPIREGQDFLQGFATHYQCIDRGDEAFIGHAVQLGGFVFRSVQPFDITVWTGNKAVDAGCDKNGTVDIHGENSF